MEIQDPSTGEWSEYRELGDSSWFGESCVVQVGSTVYRVRTEFGKLDLEDQEEVWETETLGDSGWSMFLGRCVEMDVGGVAGNK